VDIEVNDNLGDNLKKKGSGETTFITYIIWHSDRYADAKITAKWLD
jgi:hypothetical protein